MARHRRYKSYSGYNPYSHDNLHNSYDFRRKKKYKGLIIVMGIILVLIIIANFDVVVIKTFIGKDGSTKDVVDDSNLSIDEKGIFHAIKNKMRIHLSTKS